MRSRQRHARDVSERLATYPARVTHLTSWLVALLLSVSMFAAAPNVNAMVPSGDGQNAYKLAAQKDSVVYDTDVAMWDCWDASAKPSFYAWTGKSWSRWAVAETSADIEKCGEDDVKAVFRYHVSRKGKKVQDKPYRLLKVKETCKGCEASIWYLPIRVK